MDKRNLVFILFSLLCIGLYCCDLPTQPGPMPQDIINTEFQPGLNILGVIRVADKDSESFVYVEEALPTRNYYDSIDSLCIRNADVKIQEHEDSTMHTFTIDSETDSTKYTNSSFQPVPGQSYQLFVTANTKQGELSTQSSTNVPGLPDISLESLEITKNLVSIHIDSLKNIHRYDFMLYSNSTVIGEKVIYNQLTAEVKFSIDPKNEAPTKLVIVAYDKNLAKFLQASTGLFPQVYRETLSTISGGYGCFGSVCIKNIQISE